MIKLIYRTIGSSVEAYTWGFPKPCVENYKYRTRHQREKNPPSGIQYKIQDLGTRQMMPRKKWGSLFEKNWAELTLRKTYGSTRLFSVERVTRLEAGIAICGHKNDDP